MCEHRFRYDQISSLTKEVGRDWPFRYGPVLLYIARYSAKGLKFYPPYADNVDQDGGSRFVVT